MCCRPDMPAVVDEGQDERRALLAPTLLAGWLAYLFTSLYDVGATVHESVLAHGQADVQRAGHCCGDRCIAK